MMDIPRALAGLVSPESWQSLTQKVADLKNRMPFESGGGAPTSSIYTPRGYGSKIDAYRQKASSIESSLEPVKEGMTRLWRGNRADEMGENPSFTSDLPGIALPFQSAYKGPLSYVDVPTADLPKYARTSGAATNAEFIIPEEIASKARMASPGLADEQDELANKLINSLRRSGIIE